LHKWIQAFRRGFSLIFAFVGVGLTADVEFYVQDKYAYTNDYYNTTNLATGRIFEPQSYDMELAISNKWALYDTQSESVSNTDSHVSWFSSWIGPTRDYETTDAALKPSSSTMDDTFPTHYMGFGVDGFNKLMLLKFDCTNGFKHFAGN